MKRDEVMNRCAVTTAGRACGARLGLSIEISNIIFKYGDFKKLWEIKKEKQAKKWVFVSTVGVVGKLKTIM